MSIKNRVVLFLLLVWFSFIFICGCGVFFSFHLKFGEPVWSCCDVLKIKKIFSKYKLQSFCHVLSVAKGYLCYYVLKVFRELNERREQV